MNTFTKLFLAGLGLAFAQQASAQILLDNFENTRLLQYPAKSGVLTENAPNPGSNAVNSSPTCASYARNAAELYDYLVVKPNGSNNAFVNSADYKTGTKRVTLKVYSPAAGIPVQFVLQNAAKVPTGYPNGNFGVFTATTTVANAWETLTFAFNGDPSTYDATVSATDVNQFTILVNPGQTVGGMYYFDDVMGPDPTTVGTPPPVTAPVPSVLLDNFDGTRHLSYTGMSGAMSTAANPAAGTANPSANVGQYVRANGQQYDYMSIIPTAAPQTFGNVADFASGTQRVTMKFYSPAAGIPLELVMQNKVKAGTGYPNGNFGVFKATTSVANAWETLTFTYTNAGGTVDPTVASIDIDQFTMLINPGVGTDGRTYYFDDFMGPDYTRGTTPPAPAVASVLLDNYQNARYLTYTGMSGALTQNAANPASSAGNNSPTVGQYVRGNGQQYDYMSLEPTAAPKQFGNVADFASGTQRVTMKFYSPAAGIPLELVMQNKVKAGTGYPNGNFGVFKATTSVANAWETLTFNFTNAAGTVDPTVTSMDVDQFTMLINPGVGTDGRTYYFDDITGPATVGYVPTAVRAITSVDAAFAPVYPNPARDVAHLPVSLAKASTVSLAVYDAMGRRVQDVLSAQQRPAGKFTADVNTAALAPGLYTCRLVVNGVVLTRPLSVQ
ncbi:T9SS type A sorting domain-containing protein [Hymenobacter sp. ASUV-10]|uniref:T9SS type A sorting domain-containing protein n=1 Tax=Hymenobacter aranciens TaxID=3063996 RepID=A0ABT9B8B5_9BACT|nr:T9SS type A sorting domain-containing protein [Hymenobacter sp. ASUV-10]MDO7874514.1 T9SS type A sorting domain-containing protein [Hymenobacter sp. ASUV-10]